MTPSSDVRGETIAGTQLLLIFVALLAVFGLTASWESGVNVDAVAAAIPAWSLVQHGSIVVDQPPAFSPWMVETAAGFVSNRPPGMWLAAVPGYLVAAPFTDAFTNVPATALAVLATAGAVVILMRSLGELLGRRAAWIGGFALAVGSPTWTISSAQLWPHGVNQLLIALGVLSAIRRRWMGVGVCFAGLILTRPPLAIAGAVVGLGLAWSHRELRTLVAIGVPQIVAFIGLLTYNWAIFGSFGISGGYAELVEGSGQYRTVSGYLSNLAGTLISSQSGLIFWAGWTLVGVYFGIRERSRLPDFVKWFAIAGAAYLLVHTGLNRYWGGLPYNFRYAIEPITMALPLLTLGLFTGLQGKMVARWASLLTLGVSTALQASDAILGECQMVEDEMTCRVTGFW